jgi:hypothetical protein
MLVAIYSPAPQSGKSTIADHLIAQHGFARLSFAAPLKAMLSTLLIEFGYNPGDAYAFTHNDKNAPIPEIDSRVDARHLLRTLGTEWGRQCVHPELWLRCWATRYMRLRVGGIENVVVDDVRYENEAILLSRFDAQLWKVTRPGIEHDTDHASEGGLDHLLPFDDPNHDYSLGFHHVIHNNSSVNDLRSAVDAVLCNTKTTSAQ